MTTQHHALMITLLLALGTYAWSQTNRQATTRAVVSPVTSATALADSVKLMDEASAQLAQLNESHARAIRTGEEMSRIYSDLNGKINDICRVAEGTRISPMEVAKRLTELCEAAGPSNLQHLKLQTALQNENRSFTMLSNIMKTKHDTVKNAISNIR
jgi:hypothetical protein